MDASVCRLAKISGQDLLGFLTMSYLLVVLEFQNTLDSLDLLGSSEIRVGSKGMCRPTARDQTRAMCHLFSKQLLRCGFILHYT